jgi:hypothetical protein
MWRTNTMRNTCDCQAINPKLWRVTTPSPPQRLLDLLNLTLMHKMCPAMKMNTKGLKMGPK